MNKIKPISVLSLLPALVVCAFPVQALAIVNECKVDEFVRANFVLEKEIKPLVEAYCHDCHTGEKAKAGVDLSLEGDIYQLLGDDKKWRSVLQQLKKGAMPPKTTDQPEPQERKKLVAWMDHVLNDLNCSTSNTGTVTIRRLNRVEYRNTVRDLVGVDYQLADDFPGDDVGYGFDNIGDVLSLPPILMEKYLSAAEEISRRAIVDVSEIRIEKNIAGKDFTNSGNGNSQGLDQMLYSNGVIETNIDFPMNGEYRFELQAYGHQAGEDWVKMGLVINGNQVKEFELRETSDDPATKAFKTKMKKGKTRIGISFNNDFYNPGNPDRSNRDRNLVVQRVKIFGPTKASARSLPDSHRELVIIKPGKNVSREEAAEKVIRRLASKAYRRVATKLEIDRLKQLFDLAIGEGESFEGAIRLVLQAILVSPHFLFKVERPIPENGSIRELNEFELATSLSYFLWSTMPDKELLNRAFDKKLLEADEYRIQVERMLRDKKLDEFVENFSAQWLQLRGLAQATPDPELFAGYDERLQKDLIRETTLFFGDAVRNNRSILSLLESEQTFLNERLAKHYGIKDVKGSKFRKVNVAQFNRGGLLTQGSILTLTSTPTRTSPVKRGAWVLDNLLGEPPPPPDPAAMPLAEQAELTGTIRERMEQHRRDPNCASCHQKMDPIGFSLEHFDAIGRWRDSEGDQPVDASGKLPDGKTIDGANELQRLLTTEYRDQFVRCFVEKTLTYALGRGLEYHDRCHVDQIMDRLAHENYRFHALIMAIVESVPFKARQRTAVLGVRPEDLPTKGKESKSANKN